MNYLLAVQVFVRIPPVSFASALTARSPDGAFAKAARRYGMAPQTLSAFTLVVTPEENGLVLGYGNTPLEKMGSLVTGLGRILQGVRLKSHVTT